MSNYSLARVTITIYDVGAVISEGWLEDIEHGLWLLPPECEYVGECLVDDAVHPYRELTVDNGWVNKSRQDYRFAKWGLHFKVDSYAGEIASGGWPDTTTALEYNAAEAGADYLFKDCLSDLLSMADDLIDRAVFNKKKARVQGSVVLNNVYEVSFVTIWSHEYYRCSWEYEEYDFSWGLLGRVDVAAQAPATQPTRADADAQGEVSE